MKYLMLGLALGCFVSGCCTSRNPVETSACFEVGFTNNKERFVITLVSPQRIKEARELIGMDPEAAAHVSGIIAKGRASYNPQWRFFLEPSSIEFVSQSTEICDAAIKFVDENLDSPGSLFPPGARWCPWHSRVLRELP